MSTDKRKSQKFGQDLFIWLNMKSNDIDALHELMKQAPDLNTKDKHKNSFTNCWINQLNNHRCICCRISIKTIIIFTKIN